MSTFNVLATRLDKIITDFFEGRQLSYQCFCRETHSVWLQCLSLPLSAESLLVEITTLYNRLVAVFGNEHNLRPHSRLVLTQLTTEVDCQTKTLERVAQFCCVLTEGQTDPILKVENLFTKVLEALHQCGPEYKKLKRNVCMVASLWTCILLLETRGPDNLLDMILRTAEGDKVDTMGGFLLLATEPPPNVARPWPWRVHAVSNGAHYLQAVNSFLKEKWEDCKRHLLAIEKADKFYYPHALFLNAHMSQFREEYDQALDIASQALDLIRSEDYKEDCNRPLEIQFYKMISFCNAFRPHQRNPVRAAAHAMMLYKDLKPESERPSNLVFLVDQLLMNIPADDLKIQLDPQTVGEDISQLVMMEMGIHTLRCMPNAHANFAARDEIVESTISNGYKLDTTPVVEAALEKLRQVLERQGKESTSPSSEWEPERQSILPSTMSELLIKMVVTEQVPTLAQVLCLQAQLHTVKKRFREAAVCYKELLKVYQGEPLYQSCQDSKQWISLTRLYWKYVLVLLLAGQLDECVEECDKALCVLSSDGESEGKSPRRLEEDDQNLQIQLMLLSAKVLGKTAKDRLHSRSQSLLERAILLLKERMESAKPPTKLQCRELTPAEESPEQKGPERAGCEVLLDPWHTLMHNAHICMCDLVLRSETGKKEDALHFACQAAKLVHEDERSKYYLCRCLMDTGRVEEAAQEWGVFRKLHTTMVSMAAPAELNISVWQPHPDRFLGCLTVNMKQEMDYKSWKILRRR